LLVEYQRFLDRARGIKRAEMTVALPLSEGLKRELDTRLAFLAGQDIRLEIRVAPSILGGFVLRLGDRVIDASLKKRLELLGRRLKGIPV